MSLLLPVTLIALLTAPPSPDGGAVDFSDSDAGMDAALPASAHREAPPSLVPRSSAPSRKNLPSAVVHSDKRRFVQVPPDERADIVREVVSSKADFTERLLDASARFLGTPYVLDALGEGQGEKDADPLIRYDAADCMTFVETVLALALSDSPEQAERHLTAIRYAGGVPSFANRHHFFTAQWVPAQKAAGILRDITEDIARSAGKASLAVRHAKNITAKSWANRQDGRRFVLPKEQIPLGNFPLTYIPIGSVLRVAGLIPEGAVFALVREDRPASPFLVTHVGFVVRRDGKTWLRHAGRDLYGQIVDEEIGHYVRRAARYRKWVVSGMQFFEAGPARGAEQSEQKPAGGPFEPPALPGAHP